MAAADKAEAEPSCGTGLMRQFWVEKKNRLLLLLTAKVPGFQLGIAKAAAIPAPP